MGILIRSVIILAFLIAGNLFAATSASQNGITWTWTENRTTGQFVNGEWWVIGPITLTNINPGATTVSGYDVNGSMINPSTINTQGLDNRSILSSQKVSSGYSSSLNIAKSLPRSVANNSSILSVRYDPTYDGTDANKEAFITCAVLTVLATAPPADAFRPSYFGTTKRIFTESQLNYNVLNKKAPTSGAVTPMSQAGGEIGNVLIDLIGEGSPEGARQLKAVDFPSYGREIAIKLNQAALSLQLNYTDAQKRDLVIEMVQMGIDAYGGVKSNFTWNCDGGHRMGRKIAMFIAAMMLNDADMLTQCDALSHLGRLLPGESNADDPNAKTDTDSFQEGQQHFYVDQATIDANSTFSQGDLGIPEWGFKGWTGVRGNTSYVNNGNWTNGYRRMNAASNTTVVLVVHLMGGESIWNDDAMFDYITDRAYPQYAPLHGGGVNFIPNFTWSMWEAYYGDGGPTQTGSVSTPVMIPSGGVFQSTQNVSITTATEGATIYYEAGASPPNPTTSSTVYTGPIVVSASTTIKAFAVKFGLNDSAIRSETYSFAVNTPTASPPGDNYIGDRSVTLLCSTPGAEIRYTTDGSTPTGSSTLFTTPITVSASNPTTVIKAIGIKAGITNSAIMTESYSYQYQSGSEWENVPLQFTETSEFQIEFDATPSASLIDSVTGLSNGQAAAYSSMACIFRFNPSGFIDTRNGSAYQAANVVPYSGGTTYHFRAAVNVTNKTYSAWVTPSGGSETQIAADYAFRTEQAAITSIGYLTLYTQTIEGHLVENAALTQEQVGGITSVTNLSVGN